MEGRKPCGGAAVTGGGGDGQGGGGYGGRRAMGYEHLLERGVYGLSDAGLQRRGERLREGGGYMALQTAYRLQLQPGLGGQAHQRGTNVNASGTMAGQWCATHFLPTGRGTDRGDRPQIRERNLPKNIPMCHKMMRRRGRLLSAPFSCRNFALDKSADVNNKTITNNSYSLKNKKVLWQN